MFGGGILNLVANGKQDLFLTRLYWCDKCNEDFENEVIIFEKKVISEMNKYTVPDISTIILNFAEVKYEHHCNLGLSRAIKEFIISSSPSFKLS